MLLAVEQGVALAIAADVKNRSRLKGCHLKFVLFLDGKQLVLKLRAGSIRYRLEKP